MSNIKHTIGFIPSHPRLIIRSNERLREVGTDLVIIPSGPSIPLVDYSEDKGDDNVESNATNRHACTSF